MEIAALGLKVDGVENIERARDSLGRFKKSADGAEKSTDGLGSQSAAANHKLVELAKGGGLASTATNKLASAARGAAIQLGAMAAAALGIREAARTIADFESSISAVAAVTRASTKDMESMRVVAKKLGSETEFSASQAADGFKYLGLAGWDAAQSIAAIPSVVDLATAASMGLADAADTASNIMSAFGIAAEQAAQVTDVLAAASSRANTDVRQLGEGIKYVGPVAAAMGISVSDTAAAMGVLADAGIQASMGGTGLRRVLSSLANPTGEAAKSLKSMGLTIDELNPKATSIEDIVAKLSVAGLSAAEALTIFGDRGGPAILALTDGLPKLRELTSTLRDVDGETKRMADTMRDNLAGDFKGFQSALESVVISLGDAGLTAALREATQGATELLRAMSSLVDFVGENMPAIASVMAFALGPKVFAVAVAGVNALSDAFVVAGRTLMAAFLSNPITAILAAAGALVVYMYSIRDEVSAVGAAFDTVEGALSGLWQSAKEALTALGAGIRGLVSSFTGGAGDMDVAWHDVMMGITGAFDSYYNAVLGGIASIGAGFRALGQNIRTALGSAISWARNQLSEYMMALSGFLDNFGLGFDYGYHMFEGWGEYENIIESAGKAYTDFAGTIDTQSKYIGNYVEREMNRAGEAATAWAGTNESAADAFNVVTKEVENNSRSLGGNSKKLSEAAKAAKKFADEREQTFKLQRDTISGIHNEAQALEDQITVFGKGKRALEQLGIARLQEKRDVLAGLPGHAELIELMNQEIDARERLLNAGFTLDALDEGKRANQELADEAKRTHDEIERSLTDSLMRSFESGKGFAKSFLDSTKSLASTLILRPIVQPISEGIAGAVTGALGMGKGSSFGLLDGLGMASNLKSLAGVFSGSLVSSMGSGIASLGTTFGSSALGSFAAGMKGSTLAAGLAGPTTAGAGGAMGAGAAFGAALPWVAGGLAVASIVPAVHNMFKGEKRGGAYFQYDQETKQAVRKGGASAGDGGPQTYAALTQSFGATQNRIEGLFNSLGIDASVSFFEGMFEDSKKGRGGVFSGGLLDVGGEQVRFGTNKKGAGYGDTSGSLEEMFENLQKDLAFTTLEAWQSVSDQMPSVIGSMIEGVDVRALSAEQAAAAVEQITGIVGSVNMLTEAFNQLPLLNLRDLTFDATAALMEFAGGVESLTTGINTYYQGFYDESERQQQMLGSMTASLSELGQAFPASKQGYRDLVDGLDLSTEAGQKLYVALTGMSGAAASYYDYLQQQKEALLQQFEQFKQQGMSSFNEISVSITQARDTYLAALREQHEAAVQAVRDEYSTRAKAIRDSIGSVNERLRDLNGVLSSLGSGIASLREQSELATQLHRTASLQVIDQALAAARAGQSLANFTNLQDSIQSASKLDANDFGSLFDFELERAETVNRLKELEGLTGGQIDVQELQLNALQTQLERLDDWRDVQLELLKEQYEEEQKAAKERFEKMLADEKMRFEQTLTEMLNEQANQLLMNDSITAGAQSTSLGLSAVQRAVDSSASRIATAISNIKISVTMPSPSSSGTGSRLPAFADGGYHAGGWAMVGERGPEIVNFAQPSMIYSHAQSRNLMAGGDNRELVALMHQLLNSMGNMRHEVRAMVVQMAEMVGILDRVTMGGTEVRTQSIDKHGRVTA